MSYRLRGGRGKHSGYSGGPWPNEVREQPDKEPEDMKRRGHSACPLEVSGVGTKGSQEKTEPGNGAA